jgi:hypothetical protein
VRSWADYYEQKDLFEFSFSAWCRGGSRFWCSTWGTGFYLTRFLWENCFSVQGNCFGVWGTRTWGISICCIKIQVGIEKIETATSKWLYLQRH